jgi:hypothetical protein
LVLLGILLLIIALFTVLMSAAFVKPSPAYACEATGKPGLPSQEWIDKTTAIFSGRVVEIRNITLGSYDQHAVFFAVDRYWKSPNPTENDEDYYKELVVFTGTSGNVCGYEFETGKTYLVYALAWFEDTNPLRTGLGYSNKPIEEAQEDLAVLGEGTIPTKEASLESQIDRAIAVDAKIRSMPTTQEQVMNRISFIGIGGAAAAALAFFSLRRLEEKK